MTLTLQTGITGGLVFLAALFLLVALQEAAEVGLREWNVIGNRMGWDAHGDIEKSINPDTLVGELEACLRVAQAGSCA